MKDKKRILLVTLAVIVVSSIAIPFLMPDGSERYSGLEKRVAQGAVTFANQVSSAAPMPQFLKAHVEDIQPYVSEEGVKCNYDLITDPNENKAQDYTVTGRYTVTMTDRWFFGISTKTYVIHGCRVDPSSSIEQQQ